MRGRIWTWICCFSLVMVLVACSSEGPQKTTDTGLSSATAEAHLEKSAFEEKPAEELLASSSSFKYPDGVNFIPSRLTDTGVVLGEAYDIGEESNKYLASYSLRTGQFEKLKNLTNSSDFMTVGIYYADSDYLFFEEYDTINQSSYYYIWDFRTSEAKLIHQTKETPPLHYTQATRYENILYLNLYAGSANYKTYHYQIDSQKLSVVEEANSSSPIFYQDKLYYITIDNQALETAIVSKKMLSSEKKQVRQTSGASTFLTGLFSNGEQVLYLQQQDGIALLYSNPFQEQSEPLYSDTWIESLDYQGSFVSFVGNRRSEERMRSQYYLLDIDNKVNYLFDDGPILLSKNGIFWIDFKKDEKDIDKGQIYNNENSIMRFYEFEERRTSE